MRATAKFTLLLAGALTAALAQATDWLQFGFDSAHSGYNRSEGGYSTALGNTILYHYALSVSADSAPILLANVATASGIRDVLFVVAKDGTLLALDANATSLNVLWSQRPSGNGTLTTGSPVVDPGLQYVYAYGLDGNVHKYSVADGSELLTNATAAGKLNGWPEISTLKPDVEKGASALSIATTSGGATFLYSVTDGYIGDGGDYQGHITAINLESGAQKVFNSACSALTIHFVKNGLTSGAGQNDCSSKQNGIWGRPGAIWDAATERVFITTGNGPFNASSGGFNWGDSVLALNPDGSGGGAGMPVDSYTPNTFGSSTPGDGLQGTDADLGSVSIAIVPSPPGTAAAYQHLGVQAGKDGCVRLLNLANLSGAGAPAHVGGELQALDIPGGTHCATGSDGPEIKPQPAVWVNPADGSSWIYVATYNNGFAAYKIALTGGGTPSLAQQWTGSNGSSPVVARGIVYYMSGTHVRALDAVTGTSLLAGGSSWTTTSNGGVHWQSPIIVNGRLYVIDNANPSQLWVYQLDGAFKSGFD